MGVALNKMDKKTITIIILSLIIVGILISLVGNFELNKIKTKSFKQGFSYASDSINNQILNNLKTKGYIMINFPFNKTNSQLIKLVPSRNG